MVEVIPEASATDTPSSRLDGVVIGVLVGFDDSGMPLVAFAGNAKETGQRARSSATLSKDDVGREVALLFEQGDPARPLIIGRIQHPEEFKPSQAPKEVSAEIDGERVIFNARKEIVLRCGKASITLTRSGKILIRGAYVLSRSSGANRIRGASVHIN
jgi:hypothetical protein